MYQSVPPISHSLIVGLGEKYRVAPGLQFGYQLIFFSFLAWLGELLTVDAAPILPLG